MSQLRDERDTVLVRRALELAVLGPLADPNPRVGAVIVDRDGAVVGEGHHRGAGTPHAEVDALARAGERARGGTAYVSLEPCNHTGRTGPCARALLEAGVARVVHAQSDPGALTGGGADTLRAAGVEVVGGVLKDEALALNRAWTFAIVHGRPMVTWKFAATLDGRSAAADGSSAWITGPLARADVHDLRAECDAVLVGTGTVLADDPALTARQPDGTLYDSQPIPVVLGDRRVPDGAALERHPRPLLHRSGADLTAVLNELRDRGVQRVFIEGGPTIASAFLRDDLVDEVLAYIAPTLIGYGADGTDQPALRRLGVDTIAQQRRLAVASVESLGDDLLIVAQPLAEGNP